MKCIDPANRNLDPDTNWPPWQKGTPSSSPYPLLTPSNKRRAGETNPVQRQEDSSPAKLLSVIHLGRFVLNMNKRLVAASDGTEDCWIPHQLLAWLLFSISP